MGTREARMKVPAERRRQIGVMGGKARAAKCSPAELSDIGRMGARAGHARRSPAERSQFARKAGIIGNLVRWGARHETAETD